ncbi:energy transducer TonB [Spirosoma fluviale]|uniref:TonB family C-terminal domain-containing protein n=1 Tax=Spirosoma fluviale TaxID=1597977 RepID=A0A286GEM6_9BACT|nr:energy transducer TonB [Spirosoma fluviale]SOD93464.1 TonB family C-terminal domain-containing protein [Spirosoma fluviale]
MEPCFHLYIPALVRLVGMSAGLLLLSTLALAQKPAKADTTVYTVVERQPQFPGGMDALKDYLQKNISYPKEAQKAGIKGRVLVSFVIEPDGQLTTIQLWKGLGYGCDEEAMRLVEAMPCCWQAGSQSGRLLRVKYTLPILFGIDYPKVKIR